MILGIFPAIVITFFTIMGLVYIPVSLFQLYSNRQDGLAVAERSQELVKHVHELRNKWNPRKFKQVTECSICLVAYTEEDFVTPLPCDIRHYFHTECVEDWFKS